MRQTMILTVSALVVATAAAASVVHAADEAATTVAGMLEEKALMAAYNPVLLDKAALTNPEWAFTRVRGGHYSGEERRLLRDPGPAGAVLQRRPWRR